MSIKTFAKKNKLFTDYQEQNWPSLHIKILESYKTSLEELNSSLKKLKIPDAKPETQKPKKTSDIKMKVKDKTIKNYKLKIKN